MQQKQSKADILFAKNHWIIHVLSEIISLGNGWMDSHSHSSVLSYSVGETGPCGQLQPSAVTSHWYRASKTAQPMRTNVSRWVPVLVGLVQDGGAAAKRSE